MIVAHSFVRLQPRRFIPDSEISFVSGTTYETSFIPVEPDEVYQQTSLSNRNSLTFSYSGGVLQFQTGNAPNENIFCVYSIYLTNTRTQYEKQNPYAGTGSVVEWIPRLKSHPTISQSVKDQLAGIISTTGTNLSLVNDDYYFNDFISIYDNYQNADVTMWVKLNNTFKVLGSGIIKSIKAGKNVSLSVKSINKLFEQTATFGNDLKHYKATKADYPTIFPGHANRPIPYCPGFNSHIPEIPVYYDTTVGAAPYYLHRLVDMDDKWIRAIRYDNQDKHIVGVVDDIWDYNEKFAVTEASRTTITAALLVWVNIPSQWTWSLIKGEPLYVEYSDTSKLPGLIIEMDYPNNRALIEHSQPGTPALTFTYIYPTPLIMAQIPKSGSTFGDNRKSVFTFNIPGVGKLAAGFHDLLTEATAGSKKLVYIDYNPLTTPADYPFEDWFLLKNKAPQDFDDFSSSLVSGVGLSIDGTTFGAVQTANNVKMLDLIHSGEKNETIGEIFSRTGNSLGAIIYADENNLLKARIVDDNLSGFDFEVTSTDILNPDLAPEIEFNDIHSEVSYSNPRVIAENFYDEIAESTSSPFSVGFNNSYKSKSYDSNIDNVTNSIVIKKYNDQGPKVFYNFSLPSETYFDINVGDLVKISNVDGRLINLGVTTTVIVVSITKSATNLKVTGYEFSKIP